MPLPDYLSRIKHPTSHISFRRAIRSPRPAADGPGRSSNGIKKKVAGLFGLLLAFNAAAGTALILLSSHHRALVPLGLLAYVFGLRHAADADHIAAIDNTTRKLINDGQRPVGVGFFFSAGHSTVVLLMTLALVLAGRFMAQPHMAWLDIAGTGVSAVFLFLIAFLNLLILRDVWKVFRQAGSVRESGELEKLLLKRGLMSRVFGRFFQVIRHSWQMFPVGFLFGLGFDTVSEMAVLGMAAGLATHGTNFGYIFILPILFAAGMSLIDSADGVLMLSAYNWAFMKPIRKIYYNLTITAVSVLVALLIGAIEAMQVLSAEMSFRGMFWDHLQHLDFAFLGYVIIAILVLSWAVAVAVYKLKRLEEKYG